MSPKLPKEMLTFLYFHIIQIMFCLAPDTKIFQRGGYFQIIFFKPTTHYITLAGDKLGWD